MPVLKFASGGRLGYHEPLGGCSNLKWVGYLVVAAARQSCSTLSVPPLVSLTIFYSPTLTFCDQPVVAQVQTGRAASDDPLGGVFKFDLKFESEGHLGPRCSLRPMVLPSIPTLY